MLTSILELQSAVGANAKKAVLKKHSDEQRFRIFLYYALNPLLSYNLSEKTLNQSNNDFANTKLELFNDIFECCEFLSKLRGIDDVTILQVKLFLYQHCDEKEREIYIRLLSKTLRLGVTAKTVNKVIENLIPEWEVQQAYPIEKFPMADNVEFWVTQKLNGVRATFYNGQLIARSGIPFQGLDHIIKEISWTQPAGLILDGELTLKSTDNLNDNEAFRVATGILNSDNEHKTTICYTIFDAIPVKDFENSMPSVNYSSRRIILDKLSKSFESANFVRVLNLLYHGTERNKIDELLEKMICEDKEGLMINLDVPYIRTRHKGVLKVKHFYTMDLTILRCEEGSGRLAGMLGAFVLDYKGNEVKVGSGFTDEQRVEYWQSRDKIAEKICEVKYKEISSDKNTGLKSLQFPVFIQIREDKTEVSYG